MSSCSKKTNPTNNNKNSTSINGVNKICLCLARQMACFLYIVLQLVACWAPREQIHQTTAAEQAAWRQFAPVAECDWCPFNSVEATYLLISSSFQHICRVQICSDVLLGNKFPWIGFNSVSLLLDINGTVFSLWQYPLHLNADSSLISTYWETQN